jgi:FSR family fosmidomycin resistance protein-like MFS transporter
MTSHATGAPRKCTAILFPGHLVNDGYGELPSPLLPLLIKRPDLSLAMAGLLGTLRIVINSVTQPVFGLLVDRMERPTFAIVGAAVTVIAMSLVGLAPSHTALALLMLASGLGSALFHPAAATYVGRGAIRNRGLVMAFFSLGATFGASLAPILAVPFVMTFDSSARRGWSCLGSQRSC